MSVVVVFFFKQKTAYEMRISDWSSDVCSSDLPRDDLFVNRAVTARLMPGVEAIDAADWDACAGNANPFVGHAFLALLEQSGSATAAAGWQPLPIVVDGPDGRPGAIAPASAQSPSQGEAVFAHGWERA